MPVRKILFLSLSLVWLAGCTGQQPAQQQVAGYTVAMQTNPVPLQVGQDAAISIHLSKNNQPATGCQVRLRQYMVSMAMDADKLQHELVDTQQSGIYEGRSGEFSMGGDWTFEIAFTCAGESHTATILYPVKWPE